MNVKEALRQVVKELNEMPLEEFTARVDRLSLSKEDIDKWATLERTIRLLVERKLEENNDEDE